MDLTKIIENNKDLKELPFLVVFRTLQVLEKMGVLRCEDNINVETKE